MRAAVLGRLLIVLTLVLPSLDSFAKPARRGGVHPCCTEGAKHCSMKRSSRAHCGMTQCAPNQQAATRVAREEGVLRDDAGEPAVFADAVRWLTVSATTARGFSSVPEHPPR